MKWKPDRDSKVSIKISRGCWLILDRERMESGATLTWLVNQAIISKYGAIYTGNKKALREEG